MKFENVLAAVGGFGKFQFKTFLLMVTARATLPFHFLLNNYIAAIPSHHCDISSLDDGGLFRNLSQAQRLVVSIPVQEDGTPHPCQMFAEPQYHLLGNSTDVTDLPTVLCQNGWVYDNTAFKSTLASEWDLVCEKRKLNRTATTIFFLGVMVGAAVFGYLSDRFGRKRTLLAGYMITALFGFLSAFSNSFAMFVTMRFFTGLGLSGINLSTVVLAVEWADTQHRIAVTILMSLDWTAFATLLPAMAYFFTDWRVLTAAATSPLLLGVICWWWLPESARWLMANGEVKRAHYYLSQCAKVNGREQSMADLRLEALSKVIVVEDENRKYSYMDLVRTPKMRRMSLLTGILWFGVACPYYGIALNVIGLGVSIYLSQALYAITEIPAKAFVYLTLNKIGRRLNQTVTPILTGLCILCNMFIPQDKGMVQVVVGALGKMFGEAAFVVLYLYTSEIYPTVIRQNGLGYCCFIARTGVSVCPLILLLEEVWGQLPSIVFFLVAVAGGLAASFLPETRNIRLPETIEDVEGTRRSSIPTSDEKSLTVMSSS